MTNWEKSVIEKVKADGAGNHFSPVPEYNFSVHITFPNGVNSKAKWTTVEKGKQ